MPWMGPEKLAAYLDISVASVYRLVENGQFPEPTYLTPRLPRWRDVDIDAFLDGSQSVAASFDEALEHLSKNRRERAKDREAERRARRLRAQERMRRLDKR